MPFAPRTLWVGLKRYSSWLLRRPGPPLTGVLDTPPLLTTLRDGLGRRDARRVIGNAHDGGLRQVTASTT